MKQRIITAVIALLIFIPLLVVGGNLFSILVVAMGLVGMSEFLTMKRKLLISPEAIVAFMAVACLLVPSNWINFFPNGIFYSGFYFFTLVLLGYTVVSRNRFSFDDVGAIILGAIFSGLGFHYMIYARQESLWMILYAFLITWITDSGAYLIGRQIGRTKLAPHISPNKTWEGSIGGTVSAVIIVGIYLFFKQGVFPYGFLTMLGITVFLSIGAQFGDLIESAFKRHYGVKDSGKILPGHGGILDRFDSILLVLPLMHFVGLI